MRLNISASADQQNAINHLAKESKISYQSGIQTHSDLDGNLMLLQLFLGKKSDELGIFRRKKYRNEIGRRNRIQGAYRRLLVSQEKILERKKIIQEHQPKIKDFNDREESTDAKLAINRNHITSPQASPIKDEKPKIILKKLTVDELKTYLESIRSDNKQQFLLNPNMNITVDNIDASGFDLSSFNLDNFYFTNSNFNGAKFPSTNIISFDDSCNLDNSDWRGTTHELIIFGNYVFKANEEELVKLINQFEYRVNKIPTFDSVGEIMLADYRSANKTLIEIEDSIVELSKKTAQKPQILSIKNADFSRAKFNRFYVYYADFSGANFSQVVFKITQGKKATSFLVITEAGLDLDEAILEFYDNQDKKISDIQGFKTLDLSKIDKDFRGLIPNGGVVAKEYYQKMSSGQEILILINFDPTKIPQGLLLQNIDNSVKSISDLTKDVIDDLQKIGVKIGEIYYSRFNIKFVTQEMLGDKKADYQIHVNLLSGVDSAFTDHCNIFALGAKEALIVMSENELGIDFSSILCHEIGHVMLFQHPMGSLSNLRVPSHMSYLIPMAQGRDDLNRLTAKNILPFFGYSIADQKILEIYMSKFGRSPRIKDDLERELGLGNLGIYGSYNPDENFNNIAKISPEILNQNYTVILMNATQALVYCQNYDLLRCDQSIGYENAFAVMVVEEKTAIVKTMAILDGKNPKIKIGKSELKDLEDLLIKDGFSIIDVDQEDRAIISKFSKIPNSNRQELVETKLFDDPKITTEKQDQKLDLQEKIYHSGENLLAKRIASFLGIGVILVATSVLVSRIKRNEGRGTRPNTDLENPTTDSIKPTTETHDKTQ